MSKSTGASIVAKTTTARHEITFNEAELRALLCLAGIPVPPDAGIHVRVPGGGDWSNTSLSINAAKGLKVTWVTTETT